MFLDIKPGAEVVAQGRRYRITHPLDLNSVLAQDVLTGAPTRLPISDLGDPGGDVPPPNRTDLASTPEVAWRIAQCRYKVIQSLLDTGIASRQAVKELAIQAGVHSATVYRWLRRYERWGEVASLLPGKPGVHGACKRLSAEVETIVETVIQSRYLNRQRLSAEQICRQVFLECRQAGLKPPHGNTVRRRIAAIPEQERVLRRQGTKAMNERFSPLLGEFPGADRPLAVVQIDHTKLDLIVVDEVDRKPLARPWFTVAIDVFSRVVAGFYLALEAPGAASTGICVACAILPKDSLLAKWGITTPWPVWGRMAAIHCDNGKDFRGAMLSQACQEYGIELRFRPVRQPHYGGHIERLMGTFAREIPYASGYDVRKSGGSDWILVQPTESW